MTEQSSEYRKSSMRLLSLWEDVYMIEERGIDESERRRRMRCAIADFSLGELKNLEVLNSCHQSEISKLKDAITDLNRACSILSCGLLVLFVLNLTL